MPKRQTAAQLCCREANIWFPRSVSFPFYTVRRVWFSDKSGGQGKDVGQMGVQSVRKHYVVLTRNKSVRKS